MRWQATGDGALSPWVHPHLSFSEEAFLCKYIPSLSAPACSASGIPIMQQNQGYDLCGEKVQKELYMWWYSISEPEPPSEQGRRARKIANIQPSIHTHLCVRWRNAPSLTLHLLNICTEPEDSASFWQLWWLSIHPRSAGIPAMCWVGPFKQLPATSQ